MMIPTLLYRSVALHVASVGSVRHKNVAKPSPSHTAAVAVWRLCELRLVRYKKNAKISPSHLYSAVFRYFFSFSHTLIGALENTTISIGVLKNAASCKSVAAQPIQKLWVFLIFRTTWFGMPRNACVVIGTLQNAAKTSLSHQFNTVTDSGISARFYWCATIKITKTALSHLLQQSNGFWELPQKRDKNRSAPVLLLARPHQQRVQSIFYPSCETKTTICVLPCQRRKQQQYNN